LTLFGYLIITRRGNKRRAYDSLNVRINADIISIIIILMRRIGIMGEARVANIAAHRER